MLRNSQRYDLRRERLELNFNHKIDRFLELLAVVISLGLTVIGADGTQYEDRSVYGVTSILGIGITLEALFSLTFFLHIAALWDCLLTIAYSILFEVPHLVKYWVLTPLFLFEIPGAILFHIYLLIFNPTYWFNGFFQIGLFKLEEGNVQMYLADEIPTVLFLLSFTVFQIYKGFAYRRMSIAYYTNFRKVPALQVKKTIHGIRYDVQSSSTVRLGTTR